jgi:hypothetical protein
VTAIVPLPPSAGTISAVLDSEYVHVGATTPACVTRNVSPAMVSVAVRSAEPVLGLAVNCTSPGPVPEVPRVTTSHAAELLAVQSQSLPAATSTEPLPPAAAMAALEAESEN